jgi:hypothetical protein
MLKYHQSNVYIYFSPIKNIFPHQQLVQKIVSTVALATFKQFFTTTSLQVAQFLMKIS